METERNALSELAERLEQIAEVQRESAVFHGDPLDASDDIERAHRIVAELAKTKTSGKSCTVEQLDVDYKCRLAIVKCRKIAEESDNGK